AGGLTPENVGKAIQIIRPYAVDVAGGVETDGRKDLKKILSFVRAVREAEKRLML
ncbi:MAG: N-(5'-phosphoribosyl)anthranilate isomerase, partial [Moorella sp. (in: firmicutes)]